MQEQQEKIPHLHQDLIEPFHLFEQRLLGNCKKIEAWFKEQWQAYTPPIYGSVDLRNEGFKLAPIDMNLFPAGFNNLNPEFLPCSIDAARAIITKIAPNTKKILIIPENHTRNLFYWQNMRTLQKILEGADFTVRIGSVAPDITEPRTISLPSGDEVSLQPLQRQGQQIFVTDYVPDFVILNNDLSDGIPEILQNIDQPLYPPAELGWHQRLKSDHFQYYAEVSNEFAQALDIDPWWVAPLFKQCGEIDFMNQEGMQRLIADVDLLFAEIQKKYTEYHIPYKPFIIVKADAGTYGMAVMTVRHSDELKQLNRKQRTSMSKTKSGQPVHRVIVQEGVYTFETYGPEQAVAEPVVYLWGEHVVDGFYRIHEDRGIDENLNTPGMRFAPLAFVQPCHTPQEKKTDKCSNRFYVYGVVARLSMLAAAREIADQQRKAV